MVGVGNLELYHFDQGAFGHPRTKPTTVLSNLPQLHQLHEVRGEGHQQGPLPRDLTARLGGLGSWLGCCPDYVGDDGQKLSKMDMDAWRRHVRQDQTPFRADCRICAEAMGYDSPHRRLGKSSTKYTMAVDICGPFPRTKDPATGASTDATALRSMMRFASLQNWTVGSVPARQDCVPFSSTTR